MREKLKKIWLVRHGQSQRQNEETDDSLNPDLSDLGCRQATRLIEPLKDQEFDLILLSPLQRAWKTYQLSEAKARRVEFDSRLIESDGWIGRTYISDWGIQECYNAILPVVTPEIAEPDCHDVWLISADERVATLVEDLVVRQENNILLFGHWGVFNRIFWAFIGMDANNKLARFNTDNTGISLLEVDEKGYRFIRYWNERSHVSDLLE